MLWSAYHLVHITSCLCTLSAGVLIEQSLHHVDVFQTFYGDLFLFFFDKIQFLLCSAAHAHPVDVSSLHVCTDEWTSNSQYALPSQFSPQESASDKSQLRSKLSSMNHPQRVSPDYWWLFWILCISRYGARLAEERTEKKDRKKEEDEQFWLSIISGLPL